MELTLETNPSILKHQDPHPAVAITPAIKPEFWHWRVQVGEKQASAAFPKFFTIGCGFQYEEADWNTNLPIGCESEKIYQHIKCNRGEKGIKKADCIRAIDMLREAAIAAGAIHREKEAA